MARPSSPPTTALGVALRTQRAARDQDVAAEEVGLPRTTLSRLERGTHRPSYDTAVKLAAWLGWTVEQVMTAAATPVPGPPGPHTDNQ